MSSLTTCLKKAGSAIHADDKSAILARAGALRKEGLSPAEASARAVDEQIAAVARLIEAKASAGSGNAAPTQATQAKPAGIKVNASDSEAMRQAKADALKALGDLADIFGKGTKLNMMPEQEQKVLPVLTRLFDAAFRMGYLKFKDAARFAVDQIRAALGDDVADQITLEHLQGGYIGMSGRYRDQGADAVMDVAKVTKLKEIIDNPATKEAADVPNPRDDLEPDRQDPASAERVLEKPVRNEPDQADGGAGQAGDRAGSEGGGRGSVPGVRPGRAASARERGDQPVSGGSTVARPALVPAGADVDQRGGGFGDSGVPVETVSADATRRLAQGELAQGLSAQGQRKAPTAVKLGDLANIRETLPLLLPKQQEDVHKGEIRFAVPDGYGMLFTNGTGTGKTFTGLGLVKRFALQGKTNTIMVVPSDKIMEDWINSGARLGLTITPLASTQDAGKGIVITTYANFGDNRTLGDRQWDLVVHDEAHYLMQAEDGKPTKSLATLRALTMHPAGAGTLHDMRNRVDIDQMAVMSKELQEANERLNMVGLAADDRAKLKSLVAKVTPKFESLRADLEARRKSIADEVAGAQGAGRARAVFLSATPFAYVPTVDWSNGYLFDYGEGQTGQNMASGSGQGHSYNSGDWREKFFMQHFGYRMRYNKLTRPDAKVNVSLMERQFNAWLRKTGALSGRMLDVEADYDRRFVLVDSAIGSRIDEALKFISEQGRADKEAGREAHAGFQSLGNVLRKKFDYLSRRYLLEAIKAQESIEHVKAHMAMGRKVVVFHDYKKGGGFNPFDIQPMSEGGDETVSPEAVAMLNDAIGKFRSEFRDLVRYPFAAMPSPIEAYQKAFSNVLLFNGDVKPADRRANVAKFQDDAAGPAVILVQSAAGKEGISLHDTTGKHQRVLLNLGQPTQPTTAIQQEGRIYRTGQKTDAMFRYFNTGTDWEKWAFATTIATRSSTAENLSMGEQARALKDAFIAAFEESDAYPAGHEGEGKGGKERDKAANEALTEFDRAVSFYFGTQKKTSKTKAQEGADYFATPEPVGLKMVEWADPHAGDDMLEPSSGHGAIARWLPENTERTAIEPSSALRPRLAMVFDGKIIGSNFEDLHVSNKFDGIVMNPPFGVGGKMAIEHLAKAATHLRDGGRIVALIPTGPAADKRFDKWFYEEDTRPVKPLIEHPTLGPIYVGDTLRTKSSWAESGKVTRKGEAGSYALRLKVDGAQGDTGITLESITGVEPTGKRTQAYRPAEGLHMVANIKLPQVAFERAGTNVATRIVVIEKAIDGHQAPAQQNRDWSDAKDINELFDRVRDAELPKRAKPVPVEGEADADPGADAGKAVARVMSDRKSAAGEKAAKSEEGKKAAADTGMALVEHVTGKGKTLKGVVRKDLNVAQAKEVDAYTFKKDGGYFIRAEHIPSMLEKFPVKAGDSGASFSRSEDYNSGDEHGYPDDSPDAKRAIEALRQRLGGSFLAEDRLQPAWSGRLREIAPIADAFGTRLVGFKMWPAEGTTDHDVVKNFDGVHTDDGTTYLSVNAERPHLALLGHETAHEMRRKRPDLYANMLRAIAPYVKAREFETQFRGSMVAPSTLSRAKQEEEFVGEVLSDGFMEPQFWYALGRKSPGLLRQVQAFVGKILMRVFTTVKYEKRTLPYLNDYAKVMEIAGTVMAEYADGQAAAKATAPAPDDKGAGASFARTKPPADQILAKAMEKAGIRKQDGVVRRSLTAVADIAANAMGMVRDRNHLAESFQQGALDQFTGIKSAVTRELGNLPVDQDPYVAARLANGGTSSVMRGLLMHGKAQWSANGQHLEKVNGSQGLLDILRPLGEDLDNFFGWMVGNRAARLMGEGRENNFTPDEIKALQALGDNKKALFTKVAMQYADFKKSVLDVAEGAGLLDPVARKAWDHADYIPFYRQVDQTAMGVAGGQTRALGSTGRKGLAGQSSGVRTLRGGTSALNDPMENVLMNFSRLIDASLKNNALLKTVDALAGKSDLLTKVGYDMTGAIVPKAQIEKALKDSGVPDQIMGILPPAAFEGMAKMWSIKAPSDPDVVRVMRNGKAEFYKVADPLLLKSLTSFVPFDFPGLGAARWFKRTLTHAVTSAPEFMLRNFIRDSAAAQMITRDGFNPLQSIAGIKDSFLGTGASEAMLFAGASFQSGNVDAADPTATGRAMRRALRKRGLDASSVNAFMGSILDKGLLRNWERYREAGEAVENSNREAVYKATLKAGKGETAAAYEAKDMMDFSLRGSSPIYQVMADTLPFLNARVQGLYRLGRADPKRLAAYGVVMMLASLALASVNDGEDWYEELPDWDKDTYWHVKVGGHHFRIPKPFELGVIFSTLPERIARNIKGLDSNSKTAGRVWSNLRDQLAMDIIPQMARPALNTWANKDTFRDSPIEGMADEGKLPHLRYGPNTSATMKALASAAPDVADALGASPKRLEYLVGGYFGTVGMYALSLSDIAVRAMQDAPPQPELRADDYPIIKAFYRMDPARSTVFESDFYKLREEVSEIERSINALRKEGNDEAADELEAKEESKLNASRAIKSTAKELGDLNKERAEIYADRNMTPADKRQALDENQRTRNEITREAMTDEDVTAASR